MDSSLRGARNRADLIRFRGDAKHQESGAEIAALSRLREHWYQHAIEVCSELTPTLWSRLAFVCSRLNVPTEAVTAFIYSSPEIQAECVGGSERCLVRVSSSTVDLLTEDEFEFVIGHELGHFLLNHQRVKDDASSPEAYFQVRAQEISADRIGLTACQSLDVALRALMKTISGLTERHLRFDVAAFISQLKKIETSDLEWPQSTHPSVIIRSKALLWFSLSEAFSDGTVDSLRTGLPQIDSRIEMDLERYIDAASKRRIENAKRDLLLWMLTYEIVQIGAFSKISQVAMTSAFGQDTVDSLRSFISSQDSKNVEAVVHAKVIEAREYLEALIPISFMSEIDRLHVVAGEYIAKLR